MERLRTAEFVHPDGSVWPLAWDFAASVRYQQNCERDAGACVANTVGNLVLTAFLALETGARLSGLEPPSMRVFRRMFAGGDAALAMDRALVELDPGRIPLPAQADAYLAGEEDEPWRA